MQSYERGAVRQQPARYPVQGRQTSNKVGSPVTLPPKKEVTLTESEIKQFGNRNPRGYQKLRILGK